MLHMARPESSILEGRFASMDLYFVIFDRDGDDDELTLLSKLNWWLTLNNTFDWYPKSARMCAFLRNTWQTMTHLGRLQLFPNQEAQSWILLSWEVLSSLPSSLVVVCRFLCPWDKMDTESRSALPQVLRESLETEGATLTGDPSIVASELLVLQSPLFNLGKRCLFAFQNRCTERSKQGYRRICQNQTTCKRTIRFPHSIDIGCHLPYVIFDPLWRKVTLQCVLLRQCAVWAYVVLSKDENICAASYRLESMSYFQIGLSHPKLQQPSMCAAVQVFRSWKEEESDATVKDQLLSKQVCDFHSLSFQSGSCQLHGVASLQDHLDVILPAVLLSEDELKVEQDKLAEQNSQESHKPQPTPEEA